MSGGLRQATAFLTALGGAEPPAPTAKAFGWFPVTGIVLGAALGGLWVAAGNAWPAPVAAAMIVAADLALTGMLHFDGLVDSADGLLPHLPRERRLAVMAEPGAGAFGVGTAIAVLLLRWAALTALVADVRVLAALWCLSRTVMAVAATAVPYVRPQGLASAFLAAERRAVPVLPAAAGVVAAFALALWWEPRAGTAAVAAALLAPLTVVLLARRRIGGFTGDVLGAAGVVSETAGLVVAAARW